MSWSNGTSIFLPLGRLRKSQRFSSGTIQRFNSSSIRIRWRPKSSITSVPQLLFICSGASQMPVDVFMRHFQRGHGQFAADDDRGPADADPALVDLPLVVDAVARLQGQFLVVDRIEKRG